jgi:catechol-2,3-dioxygenase
MEQVITRLVQDFERGKLTRRQLIQSLAFAVTAVTTSVASSTPERTGFNAVAVNHISYQVADYANTRDFYADLLGMKVSKDTGKECHLAFGDSFIVARNRPENTPRIDHIAYTLDNWDKKAVEAELKRRGLEPKADTENSFMVKDLNGFDVQISGREMKA